MAPWVEARQGGCSWGKWEGSKILKTVNGGDGGRREKEKEKRGEGGGKEGGGARLRGPKLRTLIQILIATFTTTEILG